MIISTNGTATEQSVAREAGGHPPHGGGNAASTDTAMTSSGGRTTLWILGIGLLLLTVAVALAPVPTIDATNAATILALVTAGALAIERIIEGVWTVVGMSSLGSWWPLKPLGDRLNDFVDHMNGPLDDFFTKAEDAVQRPTEAAENLLPWLEAKQKYLGDLRANIRKLQQLEPGDPAARAIANGASRAVVGLQKHYPDLQDAATRANGVLASMNEFVQTFDDNPARRLMSLYAGAVLGLLVAGIFGLDAIQAVFEGKPKTGLVGFLYEYLKGIGVAATGLAMGAGATPTHELIKTLKETKERNKRAAHTP